MKWFIYSSKIIVIFYLFGIYLNLTKKIDVIDFYYSPIFIFFLIAILLLSLLFSDKKFNNKDKDKLNDDNNLQQITYNNATIDIDVLLNELYPILQQEEFINTVDFKFSKDLEQYVCKINLSVKSDGNVSYDTFTKKINVLISEFFEQKFSTDFKIKNEIILSSNAINSSIEEKFTKNENREIIINENVETPLQDVNETIVKIDEDKNDDNVNENLNKTDK
jgi:hypothetical protein